MDDELKMCKGCGEYHPLSKLDRHRVALHECKGYLTAQGLNDILDSKMEKLQEVLHEAIENALFDSGVRTKRGY
jgi:hypothetical protein